MKCFDIILSITNHNSKKALYIVIAIYWDLFDFNFFDGNQVNDIDDVKNQFI